MKDNAVTMQRIASEAGVSIATVSRVLAGKGPVAENTRAQIQALIEKYQFRPNSVARSLVQRQSRMLGMMVQDISNPYFAAMYLQAERYASEQGYSLLLTSSLSGNNERESISAMRERQVDGMIMVLSSIDAVSPPQDLLSLLNRLKNQSNLVLLNDPVTGFDGPYISPDNQKGFFTATKYLLSLGHTKIAFIGGSPDTNTTNLRLNAYRGALLEANITPDPGMECLLGYAPDSGESGLLKLMSQGTIPTAIIAVNDLVAMGVIRMCMLQGLRVPQDISLIGCDNTFFSKNLYPALTTIDIFADRQGEMAVQLLLSMLSGETPPAVTRIDPQLIIRGSTTRLKNV